jgi:hypothetical protein
MRLMLKGPSDILGHTGRAFPRHYHSDMNVTVPGFPGGPPRTAGHSRRQLLLRTLAAATAAACYLALAIVTGAQAHARLTRPPTSAELSAAAGIAVADRWRTWPAGRIFPAQLGYSTSLLTQETASRVGISPATSCRVSLDAALHRLAVRDGCRAAVRATYLDQLQGVVFTIGVLAFSSARQATSFAHGIPGGGSGAGLLAQAFPGTASAAFNDAARQALTKTQQGPYVVLTASGYADGRAAAVTGEANSSVFAPASQLAAEVIAPLVKPAQVNCGDHAEWSC